MATVAIIFQQNSDGYSTPGSRDDLVLNAAVTASNQSDAGVTQWLWEFISIPFGSAAAFLAPGPTNNTVQFIPDLAGTYLVSLTVNGGSMKNSAGASVRTQYLHIRLPAAKETSQFDGYYGWSKAIDEGFELIDDAYGSLSSSALNPDSGIIGGGSGAGSLAWSNGQAAVASPDGHSLAVTFNGGAELFATDGISADSFCEVQPTRITLHTPQTNIGGNADLLGNLSLDGYIDRSTPGPLNIGPNTATGGTVGKGGTTGTLNWGVNGSVLYSQSGTHSLNVNDAYGVTTGSLFTSTIDTITTGLHLVLGTDKADGGQIGNSAGAVSPPTGYLLWGATATSSLYNSDPGFIAARGGNQLQLDSLSARLAAFGEGVAGISVVFQDGNGNQPYTNVDGRFGVNVNTNGFGQPAQTGAFASGTSATFQVAGLDPGAPVASITGFNGEGGQVGHMLDINNPGNTGGDLFNIDASGNVTATGSLNLANDSLFCNATVYSNEYSNASLTQTDIHIIQGDQSKSINLVFGSNPDYVFNDTSFTSNKVIYSDNGLDAATGVALNIAAFNAISGTLGSPATGGFIWDGGSARMISPFSASTNETTPGTFSGGNIYTDDDVGTVISYGEIVGTSSALAANTHGINATLNASIGYQNLKYNAFSSGYMLSVNGAINLADGSSAPVSPSNTGAIRYNTSKQYFEVSVNGGDYARLAGGSFRVDSSGDISIDTSLGDACFLGSTGSISSITLSNGTFGQTFTLDMFQGDNSYTWPTTIANARIAGGTFTKSPNIQEVDTLTFRWNDIKTRWDEIGRATNIS